MNRWREEHIRRQAEADQERLSKRDEQRLRAGVKQKPFAGKNKIWWTEAELFKWILFKGFAPRLPQNSTMTRTVIGRALLKGRIPPDKAPLLSGDKTTLFGGKHAATAIHAIAKTVKKGLLQTKVMRGIVVYNVEDAKRLWQSVSGPGKGRPRKIAADGQIVEQLAQIYLTSSRRITREAAFGLFGEMGADRFQRLREDALRLAGRNIAADRRHHTIDAETVALRLSNLALQKKSPRAK